MLTRCLMLAPIALLTACGANPEAVLDTVRMTEQAMLEAIAADDLDGIVRNYEDQAVLVGPGSSPEVGKAAIRAAFEEMLADPGLKVELTPGKAWASESGELAVATGIMRLTTTSRAGEPYTVDMHNQTVWRRDDGNG